MAKKTKYIILGTAVIAIIVTVVLLFTLGGDEVAETENQEEIQKTGQEKYSSMTIQELTKEYFVLFEDTLTKLEKEINSKEDTKKLYKEVLPQILDMLPSLLVKGKDYIDSKGGIEQWAEYVQEDPRKAQEIITKDFEDVIGKIAVLSTKIERLDRDEGFQNRMRGIFDEEFTDTDKVEVITFTIDEYQKSINNIANNQNAIEAINMLIELARPPYRYEYPNEENYTYYDSWGNLMTDWEAYDRDIKEIPTNPVIFTEEKLLSLSKIIEREFKNVKTMGELERAIESVGKEFELYMLDF